MADTPEEVADRLCNVHGTHNGAGERGLSWCLCRPIEDALREADKRGEARGFAKGLEAAARVADAEEQAYRENAILCDRSGNIHGGTMDHVGASASRRIAAAIRLLAAQPPPEVAAAEPKP